MSLRDRFQIEGCAVVSGWLSPAQVERLRRECDALVGPPRPAASPRQRGCVFAPQTGCTRACTEHSARLAALTRELLGLGAGQPVLLVGEQFIVKEAHSGEAARFAWHRDGEALGEGGGDTAAGELQPPPPPYVSVWVALDDADEENGGLCVLRGSHADGLLQPPPGSASASLEPLALSVAAGDAVALHSRLLHCSGPNLAGGRRRAWMPQAAQAALRTATGSAVGLALELT